MASSPKFVSAAFVAIVFVVQAVLQASLGLAASHSNVAYELYTYRFQNGGGAWVPITVLVPSVVSGVALGRIHGSQCSRTAVVLIALTGLALLGPLPIIWHTMGLDLWWWPPDSAFNGTFKGISYFLFGLGGIGVGYLIGQNWRKEAGRR